MVRKELWGIKLFSCKPKGSWKCWLWSLLLHDFFLAEKLLLWVIPCPYWRVFAPNGMSITWLKVVFVVRNMRCCHKEPRMNMNVLQASPKSGMSQSKDGVKCLSPWCNYWVKRAACNYDDIKPDKIFGLDSLLIYTGMNQETVRGDLGQREFFR